MKAPSTNQPLLPRISMRWYFILALVVASFLTWLTRSAYQQSLLLVTILLAVSVACFLTLTAVCFFFAYMAGSLNKLLQKPAEHHHSPFAHESMPPQIIPPGTRES
jgi:glucan phosphoethanolaminetransferase (alkaline phosphatase superfamily)